jgi:hypothetical protein
VSFILDALRKAERQRRGEQRGGVLGPPPSRPRRRGLWGLVAALVVLNGIGWSLVLWRAGPGARPGATAEPVAAERAAGDATPARIAGPPGPAVDDPLVMPAPGAAGAGLSGAVVQERQPRARAFDRNAGARPPTPRRREFQSEPSPRGGRPSGIEPAGPRSRAGARLAEGPPVGPSAGAVGEAAVRGQAVPERREPAPSPRRPDSGAPEGSSGPPAVAARGAGPTELPPFLREALGRLRLEVLVDADDPRDREVFINGRRYRAGDRLDDDIVVEAIVTEGVQLSWQGHRAWLRHARPP